MPISTTVRLGPSTQTVAVTFPGVTVSGLNPNSTAAVSVSGASGTFSLTVNGQTTSPIPIGSGAGVVQTAVGNLSGIGAGNVTVIGILPYLITAVGSLAGQTLTVTVNTSGLSSTFASVPGPDIAPGSGLSRTVLNTDPGCAFTGGWTRTNDSPSGTSGARFTSAIPGPLTPSLASYAFSSLSPGNYMISATWPPGGGYASNAPFRVYDGTTLRGIAYADQTSTPGVLVYNSFNRTRETQVYCSSGTLTVVLSNDANNPVVADAVVVQPVTALSIYAYADDQAAGGFPNSGDCVFNGSAWQLSSANATNSFGYFYHFAPAGTGTNSVVWRSPPLSPGTYDVQAYWNPIAGGASNAVYGVHDGTSLLSNVTVNQQAAPSAGLVTTLTGYSLTSHSLGVFTLAGNQFVVTLSDNANGTVVADAILFIPTGSTPPIGTPIAQTIAVTSSVASYGGNPSIKVNAGSPITLVNPVWEPGYILYTLASPVASGASVTFTAPANWALTSAGGAPALTNQPVTTGLTSFLAPFNPFTAKTLRVGYHAIGASYTNPVFTYTDLMKVASGWSSAVVDANGWPVSTTGNNFALLTAPPANFIDGTGLPSAPFGPYAVLWDTPDGSGNVTLASGGGDSVSEITGDQANLGALTNRTRVFTYSQANINAAPSVVVIASGHCTNIRVYPPGVATDGSAPLYHPNYTGMLSGCASIRTSGFVQVNYGNVVDYSDFPSTTRRSYSNNDNIAYNAIASFSPGPTPAQAATTSQWFTASRPPFVITTASPHNFKTGHVAQFLMNSGVAVLKLSDGETWDLSGSSLTAIAIDSTNFACSIPNSNPVASVAYTGGAFVYHDQGGSPPEHAVALANAVPGSVLHLNIPQAISDAAATTLFQMVASNLNRNQKLRIELSNEPWNFAPPYEQYNYFTFLGINRGGLLGMQAYTQRSSEIHAIATTAFAAVGRPSTDILRFFNSQNIASVLNTIFDYAANPTDPRAGGKPIQVDEIGPANYYLGGNSIPAANGGLGNGTLRNALTLDQVMDFHELHQPGTSAASFGTTAAAITAAGPRYAGTGIVAYEWGPGNLKWDGDDAHLIWQSQGAVLHPRMGKLLLHLIQESNDAGASTLTKAGLAGPLFSDQFPPGTGVYPAYYGWQQVGGIGDGSDGLASNLPGLASAVPGTTAFPYDSMVSPIGGAINYWNGLVSLSPRLDLSPVSETVATSGVVSLTATLTNSTASLTAATTAGTLSTTTPTNGVPFTLTVPGSGSGTITVTVTDSTDSLSRVALITYGSAPVTPVLSLTPPSQSVAAGANATLTATLANASGALAAVATAGTLSTSTPTSGTPFTVTAPTNATGSLVVTITDATDGLTCSATVNFAPASLTLTPLNQSVSGGGNATLTATLVNSNASLSGTASAGTPSTFTPTSGTPFTIAVPSSGSGTITITVSDSADSLVATASIAYSPSGSTAPSIQILSAVVYSVAAIVTARVDPCGSDTRVFGSFGPTDAYGTNSPTMFVPAIGGPIDLPITMAPLAIGATFHYQIVASNTSGTTTTLDSTSATSGASFNPRRAMSRSRGF